MTHGQGSQAVENIWPFMRNDWVFKRVFTSHDDIVDHCCEAWNELSISLGAS